MLIHKLHIHSEDRLHKAAFQPEKASTQAWKLYKGWLFLILLERHACFSDVTSIDKTISNIFNIRQAWGNKKRPEEQGC